MSQDQDQLFPYRRTTFVAGFSLCLAIFSVSASHSDSASTRWAISPSTGCVFGILRLPSAQISRSSISSSRSRRDGDCGSEIDATGYFFRHSTIALRLPLRLPLRLRAYGGLRRSSRDTFGFRLIASSSSMVLFFRHSPLAGFGGHRDRRPVRAFQSTRREFSR